MFPIRFQLIFAIVAMSLVACGSNNNSTSTQNVDDGSVQLYGAKVATSASHLPTCDSNQVGQLFYVLADQEFQFCSSEGYQSIDIRGVDGTDGADGANGINGTNGADGENGADGSSCSVVSSANGRKTIICEDGTTATVSDGASCTVVDNGDNSYDLTCSGTTVTVQNGRDGVDGADGVNGINGTSCSVADNGMGTLTQTCTDGTSVSWPKALCGGVAYEPTKQACAEKQLYPFRNYTNTEITAMSNLPSYCATPGNCGVFEDLRDSHEYRWTKIGTQIWMAENLAYLPSVNAKSDSSSTVAKYYVYNYDGTGVATAKASSNYTTYGVLYNWPAVMAGAESSSANPSGVKGICPTGWHMPSIAEWTTLESYVGGTSTAGTKLKSVSGWTTGGITGTDNYGFSALPGGNYSGLDFNFCNALRFGIWWVTDGGAARAYIRYMGYNNANVDWGSVNKDDGVSVRCLQD